MSHIFEALQRAEFERTGGTRAQAPESMLALMEREPARAVDDASARESQPSPGLDGRALARATVLTPDPGSDACLVCMTDQGSLAAEKFRVLGLRLRNMRERRPLKRVLVTSTIPEEGKTFVAANLALNQSRSKILKTVLIDGDLRRPSLAIRFGLSRSLPGLAECMRGERKLGEVLYKLKNTHLWFVPAGVPPENPLELMQSGKGSEVLDGLSSAFDWVIVDSPPIIPLADTSFWTKLCDGVLLVAREGMSERRPLKRVLDVLDRSMLLGVVLNSSSSGDHKNYYQRYSHPSLGIQEPYPEK